MSRTRLDITLPDLPDEFPGLTAKELVRFIANGLRVYVPFELGQVQIGGAEPTTSNVLWFEDGVTPKVWDSNTNRFGPIDVEESFKRVVWLGVLPPPSSNPAQLWLRTFQGVEPRFELYRKRNDEWVPAALTPAVGPTESRPAHPAPFQQYFDTSINVLIHWERGAWRTVSGSPGDIKFIIANSEAEALARNPGWALLPASHRGRVIGVAGQGSGLTLRPNGQSVGSEGHTLTVEELPPHRHFVVNDFSRSTTSSFSDGDVSADTAVCITRGISTRSAGGFSYSLGAGTGEATLGRTSQTGNANQHSNMQPTIFQIGIFKT